MRVRVRVSVDALLVCSCSSQIGSKVGTGPNSCFEFRASSEFSLAVSILRRREKVLKARESKYRVVSSVLRERERKYSKEDVLCFFETGRRDGTK